MQPKVSFVVPCYRLAHFLSQCVNSLLSQSYADFEVLIMDDCSPDATPEIARSFGDRRVQHIRNESNLGHLRNYNKGISSARGRYIWLISADDYLRKPYVLERYVEVMEKHSRVGYVFCPAMKVEGGQETEVVSWSTHGGQDEIRKGHDFLKKLLFANCVVASTGLVRKASYDRTGLFPLDMPNSGDWFLWCAHSLHYDVAYLAEPMVCYRLHGDNLSQNYKRHSPHIITGDNVLVRWTLKEKAEALGASRVVAHCKDAIATYYAMLVASHIYEGDIYQMTLEECESSISRYTRDGPEAPEMRARFYTALADECYLRRDLTRARQYYRLALQRQSSAVGTWAKYLLIQSGGLGVRLRDCASSLR